MSLRSSRIIKTKASDTPFTMYMSAQPLPIRASGKGIDVTKITLFLENHFAWLIKYDFKALFNIIKYKYVKESHFCVIFPAKKFVLSMIIRIFAATESATLPI